jgi:hypothetical protein
MLMAKKKTDVDIKVKKIDLEALDEPKHASKSKKTSKTKKKDIKQEVLLNLKKSNKSFF